MVNKKNEIIIIIVITLSALIIRFGAFIIFEEPPGDGPSRAIWAYTWAESPHLVTQGIWTPGHLYLSGAFSFIINDPLVSARILNLILGGLTILFFYLLIDGLYDRFVALLSCLILTIFPLHIGLSVTSLTEVSFLFQIISGTYFLVLASEHQAKRRITYLLLSMILLFLSMMTSRSLPTCLLYLS